MSRGPLLRLPQALVDEGYLLRPQREADYPFLENLYISTRWPEFEPSGWRNEEKRAFLEDQFRLQCRHYRTFYSDAEFSILEYRSVPVGRIYVHRGADDYRVVDISIAEPFRNRGVGTTLLQAVTAEAQAHSKTASIHVEEHNIAQRLYRRLGFQEAGGSGPYRLLVKSCRCARKAS